jgi:hypothetical protein
MDRGRGDPKSIRPSEQVSPPIDASGSSTRIPMFTARPQAGRSQRVAPQLSVISAEVFDRIVNVGATRQIT